MQGTTIKIRNISEGRDDLPKGLYNRPGAKLKQLTFLVILHYQRKRHRSYNRDKLD